MNPFTAQPSTVALHDDSDRPQRGEPVGFFNVFGNKENGGFAGRAEPMHTPVKIRERHAYAHDTPFSILKSAHEDSACVQTRSRKYNDSALPLEHWKSYNSNLKMPKHDKTPFEDFFDISGRKPLVFRETECDQLYQLSFTDSILKKRVSPGHSTTKRRGGYERGLFHNITLSHDKRADAKPVAVAKPQAGLGCNCEKSQCLKMYCDCLKNGDFCGPNCFCAGCENKAGSAVREQKLASMRRKHPELAAKPHEHESIGAKKLGHKGCNCKKSGCLKNYCECHQVGAVCNEHCKCKDCKNTVLDQLCGGRTGAKRKDVAADGLGQSDSDAPSDE